MPVEVIDADALYELKQQYLEVCELARSESLKNKKLLLTPKEVAEITGYHESTIKKKKREIGYRVGFSNQDLKFKYDDVLKWVERGCIPPKSSLANKK
jgi:hypothetical protein